MPNYSYYDPNQGTQMRRDAALQRLAALAEAKNRKALAEQEQMERDAEAAERDNLGSFWGTTAGGAATGFMAGGPLGAAIGGGAGLLLGGAAEMQRRKNYEKAHGAKGYGWMDALGDTVGRAPTMNELTAVAGAALGPAISMGTSPDYQGMAQRSQAAQLDAWRRQQPAKTHSPVFDDADHVY